MRGVDASKNGEQMQPTFPAWLRVTLCISAVCLALAEVGLTHSPRETLSRIWPSILLLLVVAFDWQRHRGMAPSRMSSVAVCAFSLVAIGYVLAVAVWGENSSVWSYIVLPGLVVWLVGADRWRFREERD
jgi:hypothetical protein